MADPGSDLIDAIKNKPNLMSVDNCPGVPVQLGLAVYGKVQNDDFETVISGSPGDARKKMINEAIGFSGANSETAVWHFSCDARPVAIHHFVVVPWYRQTSPHGQVYTLFMAYEHRYTIGQYVNGTANYFQQAGYRGFKQAWTFSEFSTMLTELLDSGRAWEDYFGAVGPAHATTIKYSKYKVTTLISARNKVG